MSVTDGLLNEDKFVLKIHEKKFSELNQNLRYFISYLFPDISENDILKCYKTEDYIKPDIAIQLKDKKQYVSLKYGTSEQLHLENIDSFFGFLRSLGVEEKVLNIFARFHFGDGTIDGSGERRLPSMEVRYQMREEIKYMNEYLNLNKGLVIEVVDRIMFKGVNPLAQKADYIYYGDPDYGCFVSRNQVLKHLKTKNWMFIDAPHIGPLVLRPHARYADKEILSEIRRKQISFTYPNLEADIRYIFRRYNW